MNTPRRPRSCASFSRELEDEDSAVVTLFMQCCRESPALRHWLSRDFARNASVRERFAKALDSGDSASASMPCSMADLTGENRALREEQRRLKEQMPWLARPYGGLSWGEMEKLVRRCQAGPIDLGAFLLAQAWRGSAGKPSLALTRATVVFMDEVMQSGSQRLLRNFAKALRFLEECDDKATRRAALGYQDRWKLHTLFFMLRNPSESYRTRDIRAHLETLGFEIGTKDVRRFCTRHGIKRDVRAGRPSARTTKPAAE
jgi:hypothetical protein